MLPVGASVASVHGVVQSAWSLRVSRQPAIHRERALAGAFTGGLVRISSHGLPSECADLRICSPRERKMMPLMFGWKFNIAVFVRGRFV